MNIALCTLCLNESEFLAKSYEQHRDWPGLVSWVFVEGADVLYGEANPSLVTQEGLSADSTGIILRELTAKDEKLQLIQHGWMRDGNSAQSKTIGRERYLNALEAVRPDYFIVVDADEFYTRDDQLAINSLLESSSRDCLCWRLAQRHIWRPPRIRTAPRFALEVQGGYWSVPHVRIFRWRSGLRYKKDHNWPMSRNYHPLKHLYEGRGSDPQCIHLGFARAEQERTATNRYYRQRGEGSSDGREKYVRCRAAWETWKPGSRLPLGASVRAYRGPIPECFTER